MLLAETKDLFPNFSDGDVCVTLSSGRVHHLHSGVLRRNSPVLAKLLIEANGAILSPKAKKEGIFIRYRLDLSQVVDDGPGEFRLREVDSNGRSQASSQLPEIENGKIVKEIYKHYRNLFRAFYNEQPKLNDTNIATVLNDCMGLVDVAESLGSINVISQSVDISLLQQGQVLFRSIAANAIAWSDLAYRVRSITIFKEAIVHLVGQWNAITDADRSNLNKDVLKLCQAKADELSSIKQAIEIRILGHYPGTVQRVASDNPGRMSYSNDIYFWMVLALFRHWFSQSICEGRNNKAKDGGAVLYRQIDAAGYAYLDRKVLEGFHAYFPMSFKGSTCLENILSAYKEELKPFVAELLANRSQMDIVKEPLPYLTCCIVDKTDLPWEKEEVSHDRDALMDRQRTQDGLQGFDDDDETLGHDGPLSHETQGMDTED
ncbi:MAG: hypothetical protein M1827_004757 [Pycnora praestabilis]|nr:MAG: hypothetical protein M1827_004757 [Pycnora praestabilis]